MCWCSPHHCCCANIGARCRVPRVVAQVSLKLWHGATEVGYSILDNVELNVDDGSLRGSCGSVAIDVNAALASALQCICKDLMRDLHDKVPTPELSKSDWMYKEEDGTRIVIFCPKPSSE